MKPVTVLPSTNSVPSGVLTWRSAPEEWQTTAKVLPAATKDSNSLIEACLQRDPTSAHDRRDRRQCRNRPGQSRGEPSRRAVHSQPHRPRTGGSVGLEARLVLRIERRLPPFGEASTISVPASLNTSPARQAPPARRIRHLARLLVGGWTIRIFMVITFRLRFSDETDQAGAPSGSAEVAEATRYRAEHSQAALDWGRGSATVMVGRSRSLLVGSLEARVAS